jgi:hypothetical protein
MESAFDSLVLEPLDIKAGKLRKIYYGVEFEEYELKWIAAMRAQVAKVRLELPDFIDDQQLLKSAESTRGKAKKAVDNIKAYIKWRTTEIPVQIEEIQQWLPLSMAYNHGKDLKLRPIIIVNVLRTIQSRIDPNGLLRLSYYMLNNTVD